MSGLWLGYKFDFSENKKKTKSTLHSKESSETTQWTRGRKETLGRKEITGQKKEEFGRSKLSLDRGVNSKFSCTRNGVCVHVTCTVVSACNL